MNITSRFSGYLNYWLRSVDAHSLHAPFIYAFYRDVIENDTTDGYEELEAIRKRLRNDQRAILTNSPGAGSTISEAKKRTVANIANGGITKAKYSRFLNRLINFTESRNILELGTSLGLNTRYLIHGNKAKVTSIEGCKETLSLARELHQAHDRVNLVEGRIENVLADILPEITPVDLLFADANHQFGPTINYFEQALDHIHDKSVFVFDDIHWSREMKRAWDVIRNHDRVTLSIDLYQFGIVFFKPGLQKAHFYLKY